MSDQPLKGLPAFADEAEEAQWWYDNREAIGEEFAQAIREGRVTRGAMVRRGLARTPPAIQIDAEDFLKHRLWQRRRGFGIKLISVC